MHLYFCSTILKLAAVRQDIVHKAILLLLRLTLVLARRKLEWQYKRLICHRRRRPTFPINPSTHPRLSYRPPLPYYCFNWSSSKYTQTSSLECPLVSISHQRNVIRQNRIFLGPKRHSSLLHSSEPLVDDNYSNEDRCVRPSCKPYLLNEAGWPEWIPSFHSFNVGKTAKANAGSTVYILHSIRNTHCTDFFVQMLHFPVATLLYIVCIRVYCGSNLFSITADAE